MHVLARAASVGLEFSYQLNQRFDNRLKNLLTFLPGCECGVSYHPAFAEARPLIH
jgi:hypothetical protein